MLVRVHKTPESENIHILRASFSNFVAVGNHSGVVFTHYGSTLSLNYDNHSFDLFASCGDAQSVVLAPVVANNWQALMILGLTFDLLPPDHIAS